MQFVQTRETQSLLSSIGVVEWVVCVEYSGMEVE